MSAGQISNVTQRLLSLQKFIPSCFARKPRNLEVIDRWKATELRQFAFNTGKIVLKGILADQLYDHFMVFSVALSLLLCPTLAVEHNAYSKELMNLDACSGFPFENYLGKLKQLERSGKQPLTQVVKRLVEMPKSPLSVEASKPKFKSAVLKVSASEIVNIDKNIEDTVSERVSLKSQVVGSVIMAGKNNLANIETHDPSAQTEMQEGDDETNMPQSHQCLDKTETETEKIQFKFSN
ncbi:Cap-specific mRNA (nucleoside-2'-O-)-methyltransferase [Labeo rohita]|uniref:Cap-specific mRNA (Nucleoside-2'-O-)-methyltransferase n=1 Tax=Labeo rohita TaxID=84645 RepID=A0ABQ8L990_LABRO|nr:Cap-specific mRNA (nucleoside-2'-O-)-methyltransferase [Labeo rohita]